MKLKYWIVGIVAAKLAAAAAYAEGAAPVNLSPAFEWHVIAAATSDYVYRGVSLRDEKPTPLLYTEFSYGIAYGSGLLIGTELGRDEIGNIGTLEADATFGIKPTIGNLTLNLGAKYTGYPNGEDRVLGTLVKAERDFIEPFAGATIQLTEALSAGGTFYWSPDYYYETGEVTTVEGQLTFILPEWKSLTSKFTAAGGYVRSEQINIVAPGHSFAYWNAGIEAHFDRMIFDLRYWDTDVSRIDGYEGRFVFSAGIALN